MPTVADDFFEQLALAHRERRPKIVEHSPEPLRVEAHNSPTE
jgi:hypothetical protein